MGVSIWDIREMTAAEWMSYETAPTRINQEYISALGAMPELADYEGEVFFNTMLITSNVRRMFTVFALMEFVSLLMLVFAGVWLFGILRRGFFGKKRRFMINFFRILTLILVCVNFIFVLFIKSTLDLCLRGELMYVMRFSVGSGMLIMFLCALLGVVLRLHEKRPIVYADEEYDNAEVSYAPYVLTDEKGKKHKKHVKDKKESKEKKEKKGKKEKKEKKSKESAEGKEEAEVKETAEVEAKEEA